MRNVERALQRKCTWEEDGRMAPKECWLGEALQGEGSKSSNSVELYALWSNDENYSISPLATCWDVVRCLLSVGG